MLDPDAPTPGDRQSRLAGAIETAVGMVDSMAGDFDAARLAVLRSQLVIARCWAKKLKRVREIDEVARINPE